MTCLHNRGHYILSQKYLYKITLKYFKYIFTYIDIYWRLRYTFLKYPVSLQLLGEIERVNICVQILKNVNKDWKILTTKYDKRFYLVVTMGGLYLICVSVLCISNRKSKILGEYKSPIIRWPIFVSPNPYYTVTGSKHLFKLQMKWKPIHLPSV